MNCRSSSSMRGANSAWNSSRSAPTPSIDMAASSPVTAAMSFWIDLDQLSMLRDACRWLSTRCSKCMGDRT